ncbi:MAG: HPr(Ser) kinase/phosphatase [Bacteroidota bacterium]
MPLRENLKPIIRGNIPVDSLMQSPAQLVALTGNVGLKNLIPDKNIHRPQLALTGYVELFTHYRVQMFGNTEMFYLKSLPYEERIAAFKNIAEFDIPCIILSSGHTIEPELLKIAVDRNIAVFTTPYETTKALYLLSEFLDEQFAPQVSVHGSFVDVYGVGILFTGRSAIGKSEIALDLVERGHRLVADDVVVLTQKRESVLIGTGTNLVKHFMEIRGLGIIDVRQMFGVRAIRFQKRLEIIVELEEWEENSSREYNRTGLEEAPTSVLDVEISTVKLPIIPGKNVTVIAEVIALNYLLKIYGYNAAEVFSQKLSEEILKKTTRKSWLEDPRLIQYFQSDEE